MWFERSLIRVTEALCNFVALVGLGFLERDAREGKRPKGLLICEWTATNAEFLRCLPEQPQKSLSCSSFLLFELVGNEHLKRDGLS